MSDPEPNAALVGPEPMKTGGAPRRQVEKQLKSEVSGRQGLTSPFASDHARRSEGNHWTDFSEVDSLISSSRPPCDAYF
jgi:hypothetical protein